MGCVSAKIGGSMADLDLSDKSTSRKWISVPTESEAKSYYGQEGLLVFDSSRSHLEFRTLLEYPCAKECFCEYASTVSPHMFRAIVGWLEIHDYNIIKPLDGSNDARNKLATPLYLEYIAANPVISTEVRATLESAWKVQRSWHSDTYSSIFNKVYVELFNTLHDSIFLPIKELPVYHAMLTKLARTYNVTKASDFDFKTVIGKGGFGLVCDVVKKSTDMPYVMKIQSKQLLLDSFGDEPWRACLELHTFASCHHPFIAELVFAFQTNTLLMLVMEQGNGRDLGKLLKQGGPFSSEHVLFYSAEIVSALAYLHRKQFVYRDLKPSNVLLNADGHIQLIDFGAVGDLDGKILARCVDKERLVHGSPSPKGLLFNRERSISEGELQNPPLMEQSNSEFDDEFDMDDYNKPARARSLVGTYGYMAPEIIEMMVLQGLNASLPISGYTKAVDWWSLGVLVYKLLVGHYPFKFDHGNGSGVKKSSFPSLESLSGPVDYSPLAADPPAVKFIGDLLNTTETARLGYGEKGSHFVMGHDYFKSINWSALERKNVSPPVGRKTEVLSGSKKYHSLPDLLAKNNRKQWLVVSDNRPPSADLTEFDVKSAFFSWQYASPDAVELELENKNKSSKRKTKSFSFTAVSPDGSYLHTAGSNHNSATLPSGTNQICPPSPSTGSIKRSKVALTSTV